MHICVFSIVNYWQDVKGGMEIHGKTLSEGLAKKGHHVSIISTRHPEDKKIEERNGVKIYYLHNTKFGSPRNHWDKESLKKFFALHKQHPFDVIWSQSFAAYGFASSSRLNSTVPIIPILQGCVHQELNTFRTNLFARHLTPFALAKAFMGLFYSFYREQKPLLSIADCIITASRELINDLRRWYGERIATKAVPVFNGIDPEVFRPDPQSRHAIRSKFQIQDNEPLLMTSGTLNKEKGHHLAIKSLSYLQREIPNTKLMIVGSGESRKLLEKQMKQTGLEDKVLFTGFVPNHEMVEYYNAADIYLMPTLRIEGLPFVLLEAMSCGKPVVAARRGGNTSLVKHGQNGFLIEPGKIQQLVHYIMTMLKDGGITKRLSAAARQTILEDFTIDRMVDKTIKIMRR
jgi:glycosyltransferase involved in cell wall biosynthesis